MTDVVVGGNEADVHLTGVVWGRAATSRSTDVLTCATPGGDPCPRCGGTLEVVRGIEIGHVFKLGTKYSEAMGATSSTRRANESPDDHGLLRDRREPDRRRGRRGRATTRTASSGRGRWRPTRCCSIAAPAPRTRRSCGRPRSSTPQLEAAGLDVLLDDRDQRPGVKFKDADLIGIPLRVTVGAKSLADGKVEVSLRRDREKQLVAPAEAVGKVMELLAG